MTVINDNYTVARIDNYKCGSRAPHSFHLEQFEFQIRIRRYSELAKLNGCVYFMIALQEIYH